jgi:hypothetical protein
MKGLLGRQRVSRRLLIVMTVSALTVAACSGDSGEATMTFDGSGCTYVGPSEFALDTEATFTAVNTSATSAGYSIWVVPEGITTADIEENTIFGIGADRKAWSQPSPPGVEKQVAVLLDTLGPWAVNCFTIASDGSVSDYPATVFVVADS